MTYIDRWKMFVCLIDYWAEIIFNAAICFLSFAVVCFVLFAPPVLSCLVGKRQVKTTSLRTERCADGRRKLISKLTVVIQDEQPIRVRKNFVSDFSSIPPGLRWTMHWTRVDVAGVVHDWLYANAKTGTMSRLHADWIWCEVALSGERYANLLQVAAGWAGIRLYGWLVWRRYKKR